MLDKLIVKGTENYKCYDILKDLYANNPEFKKIVDEGIESGMEDIHGLKMKIK